MSRGARASSFIKMHQLVTNRDTEQWYDTVFQLLKLHGTWRRCSARTGCQTHAPSEIRKVKSAREKRNQLLTFLN